MHLVGCLHRFTSDVRSHRHQILQFLNYAELSDGSISDFSWDVQLNRLTSHYIFLYRSTNPLEISRTTPRHAWKFRCNSCDENFVTLVWRTANSAKVSYPKFKNKEQERKK